VFDDSGTKSIQGRAAPFEGRFKPEENLSKLNEQNPNGTWKLRIDVSGALAVIHQSALW